MKKIYTLVLSLLAFSSISKAQDTLLYEGFQFVMTSYLTSTVAPPPGLTADTMWYDFDADQLADGSGGTTPRKDGWWQTLAAADIDLYTAAGFPDTNVVMSSNSWFSTPAAANNWLITSNVQLGAHDTLFWRAAPFQTPRYMDGYKVKISTTTNDDLAFTTTLFTAAEMTGNPAGGLADTLYSNFTFAPSGAFVHGLDGTFIQNCDLIDANGGPIANPSHNGQLRRFSVPLDAYANQNIFIAFHQTSFDDNLITIDDILIRGKSPVIGIKEENSNQLNLSLFPNPATENVQVNYTLTSEALVTVNLYDITGKLIASESKGSQAQGRHFAHINASSIAKGFYTVKVTTNIGESTSKLIVK